MKEYFYFIENPEGLWYCTNHKFSEGITTHDTQIEIVAEWTNMPLRAMRFESIEFAQQCMNHEYELRKIQDTLKITEHEFVFNSVPKK